MMFAYTMIDLQGNFWGHVAAHTLRGMAASENVRVSIVQQGGLEAVMLCGQRHDRVAGDDRVRAPLADAVRAQLVPGRLGARLFLDERVLRR